MQSVRGRNGHGNRMNHIVALDQIRDHRAYRRLSYLCREDNPDHQTRDGYRALVVALAHPETSFPPLHQQAANAVAAAGRAARAALTGQSVWVPNEVRDERWAQCMTCEHLVNDRCNLCGCFFAKKIRLAQESCPDVPSRWGAYNGEEVS
jgi:hypothetical protein